MKLRILAILAAIAAPAVAWAHDGASMETANLPAVEGLPESAIQLSGAIPAMGAHYANPADMPVGPIYCVHDGKVVCLEYMLTQADFAAGKSWTNLQAMPGLPPVNHVNIEFEPNGHEGFEVPHYDIHMYFISPDERMKIE